MNRSPEPLSAEERALAERLARLDVRREPAPALDAAILAAARAAVTGAAGTPTATAAAASTQGNPQGDSNEDADDAAPNTPPKVVPLRPRKPLARLPLGLSLAASLVLAAGIGWRLADGGGSESALDGASAQKAVREEQVAYSADAAAAADATQAVILEPEMNRIPPPPPPPPLDAMESQRRDIAMAPPAPEREAKRVSSSSERDSEFVMDEGIVGHEGSDAAARAFPAEPVAQSAPALGNAAAAKPAASGGAAESLAGRARDQREAAKDDRAESMDKVQATGSRIARQATAAPPPPPAVQAPAAPAASAASVADQPFDDQPPVSADSPEFRQAWLQRIRNLFAKGQTEAGRTSLQEFRRRYPDSELPDDLKKIATTLPPPAP